jgi:hypothetical protein
MARKKKTKAQATPPSSGGAVDTAMERAENGFIIRVSSRGTGKNPTYSSRTFIAPDGQAAMRIATQHIEAAGPKLKKKRAGKSKRATTKRS